MARCISYSCHCHEKHLTEAILSRRYLLWLTVFQDGENKTEGAAQSELASVCREVSVHILADQEVEAAPPNVRWW